MHEMTWDEILNGLDSMLEFAVHSASTWTLAGSWSTGIGSSISFDRSMLPLTTS